MQVERAFDALTERAQREILEAAKNQTQQRTKELLSAVDVDRFVKGEPACTHLEVHARFEVSFEQNLGPSSASCLKTLFYPMRVGNIA